MATRHPSLAEPCAVPIAATAQQGQVRTTAEQPRKSCPTVAAKWFQLDYTIVEECMPNLSSPTAKNQGIRNMPAAIELIVRTYVRLKKRRALEELLLHRQRLALDLRRRSGLAVSGSLRQVEEDIAAIKAGLAELGKTAAVPPVGWA